VFPLVAHRNPQYPTLVGVATTIVDSFGSSPSINLPSVIDGDFMVMHVLSTNDNTVTKHASWTSWMSGSRDADSDIIKTYGWFKTAASEGSTVTVTISKTPGGGTPILFVVSAYRYAADDGDFPIDFYSATTEYTDSGTSHSIGSRTPVEDNVMANYFFALDRIGTGEVQEPSAPAGTTKVAFLRTTDTNGDDHAIALFQQLRYTAAATGAVAITTSNSCASSRWMWGFQQL
jgi:hypothetical protein